MGNGPKAQVDATTEDPEWEGVLLMGWVDMQGSVGATRPYLCFQKTGGKVRGGERGQSLRNKGKHPGSPAPGWHYAQLPGPSHIKHQSQNSTTGLSTGQSSGSIFPVEGPFSKMSLTLVLLP